MTSSMGNLDTLTKELSEMMDLAKECGEETKDLARFSEPITLEAVDEALQQARVGS